MGVVWGYFFAGGRKDRGNRELGGVTISSVCIIGLVWNVSNLTGSGISKTKPLTRMALPVVAQGFTSIGKNRIIGYAQNDNQAREGMGKTSCTAGVFSGRSHVAAGHGSIQIIRTALLAAGQSDYNSPPRCSRVVRRTNRSGANA